MAPQNKFLMDTSKFDFTFDHLKIISDFNENDGVWLWIFHVDKVPPHVGISQGNFFYSLKSNGKDEIPVSKVIEIVENKRIKLIKLNLNFNIKTVDIYQAFAQYDKAENLLTSCLAPVKNILKAPENILKLSDLLFFLKQNNAIAGYHYFNVKKSELGILKYGVEDIERRLNILHV